MMKKTQTSKRAQGTIEYLVILAVVVVVALIVVTLMINSTAPAGGISATTSQLASTSNPIAITESIVDKDGNYFLNLKNNTGQNLTIKEISIGENTTDEGFEKKVPMNNTEAFILSTNDLCIDGQLTVNEVVIKYIDEYGLTKTQRYQLPINFQCDDYAVTTPYTDETGKTLIPGEEIIPDIDPPSITLTGPTPIGAASNLTGVIDFTYTVTDDSDIDNCELIINGSVFRTDLEAPFNKFNYTLGNGTYEWDVNCTDSESNEGTSSSNGTITVTMPTFAGGSGTSIAPYQISNVIHLQNMNISTSAHYELISDIDATPTQNWNYNGTYYEGFNPVALTGPLDGANYTITGLYINRPNTAGVGLIGHVQVNIENMNLVDANVTGANWTGALVGRFTTGSTVTNCHSSGHIKGAGSTGGLVGQAYEGTVTECSSSATVTGTDGVGGLLGYNYGNTLYRSFATGDVNGHNGVGGLVSAQDRGHIYDSYSLGDVNGVDDVGGLFGYHWYYSSADNGYSAGHVTGDHDVGGYIGVDWYFTHGWGESTAATGGYWDTETSGQLTSQYGTGKTTTEMYQTSTYSEFDFGTVWDSVCDGVGYPPLQWENITNTADCKTYN